MRRRIRIEPQFARCMDFGKHLTMIGTNLATSWKHICPRGARAATRSVVIESAMLGMSMIGRARALLARPRVQILLLHHIFPDEEQPFRALLAALARTHTFISYSQAIHRASAAGAEIDRPYMAFSFDDGLQNNLRAAAILQEFGAAGMFFVCPSIIGEDDPLRLQKFSQQRLELPRPVEFMSWDDLLGLRRSGHEIGGHTMTHPRLMTLKRTELPNQIAGCREVIRERLGECRHFAWTYGQFSDCAPHIVQMVFDSGYESCASGVRGCHGPIRSTPTEPLCIHRDHIVAGAGVNQAMYFIARSAANMRAEGDRWPWPIEGT
jgi:peptidoglycan/xylan/chitin deacetylase (PgdA/CDA1 family)